MVKAHPLAYVFQVFESTINVMPTNSPVFAEDPSYPGVTDEDQSPQIPDKFLQEQDEARKEEKRMMSLEEYQKKRESSIDSRVQAVSNYVNDEVSVVSPRACSVPLGSMPVAPLHGLRVGGP